MQCNDLLYKSLFAFIMVELNVLFGVFFLGLKLSLNRQLYKNIVSIRKGDISEVELWRLKMAIQSPWCYLASHKLTYFSSRTLLFFSCLKKQHSMRYLSRKNIIFAHFFFNFIDYNRSCDPRWLKSHLSVLVA